MTNRNSTTKEKDEFYLLVAPAIAGDGVDYFDCEAIYGCYFMGFEAVWFWCTVGDEFSNMPSAKAFPSARSIDNLTSDMLAKIQLHGRLISVDIEKRRIVKVTKTVEVKYEYEDLAVPVSV